MVSWQSVRKHHLHLSSLSFSLALGGQGLLDHLTVKGTTNSSIFCLLLKEQLSHPHLIRPPSTDYPYHSSNSALREGLFLPTPKERQRLLSAPNLTETTGKPTTNTSVCSPHSLTSVSRRRQNVSLNIHVVSRAAAAASGAGRSKQQRHSNPSTRPRNTSITKYETRERKWRRSNP